MIGQSRKSAGSARPARFQMRRLVQRGYGEERIWVNEPWEWKATQRAPFVKRAENRARNKRQRKARRANR